MTDICEGCLYTEGHFKDWSGKDKNLCGRDRLEGVKHHVPHPLASCPYKRVPKDKPKEDD